MKDRSIANSNLGVNYLALGKFNQASDALLAAKSDRLAAGERWISIGATSYLADTYHFRGCLDQAADLYMEAIDLGRNPLNERLFPVAGHACAGLGRILYERGKIDQAQNYLVEAAELGKSISFWGIVVRALGPLAWAQFMQGESVTAQATVQRALEIAARAKRTWSNVHYDTYLMPLQARLWLLSGADGQAKAVHWAENYLRSRPDASSYSQEFAQLTLAQVEIMQDAHQQAIQRLQTLAQAASERDGVDGLIKIYVLKARAEGTMGDSSAAHTSLERALELAADEGYYQTFIDEGSFILEMLGRTSHPYASQIINKEMVKSGDRGVARADKDLQSLEILPEETLSRREIEVLQFLAAGLSYAEVAEKMFLSLNTIKWYVKKIYRKLGVNRRTHAITKARKLGLLP